MQSQIALISLLCLGLLSCGKNPNELSRMDNNYPRTKNQSNDEALLAPSALGNKTQTLEYKSAPPNPEDKLYVSIDELTNAEGDLEELVVTAYHLVLSPGHEQGVWEILESAVDTEHITLNAHRIEISAPLKLSTKELTIQATDLIFKRSGKIDITPKRLPRALKTESGIDFPYHPQVNVFTENLEIPYKDVPVIIANGGQGQDAGPGIPGANGRSVGTKEIIKDCPIYPNPHNGQRLPGIGSQFSVKPVTDVFSKNDPKDCLRGVKWPQNGKNATPPGKPGKGGPGGYVVSNKLELKYYIENRGGGPGQEASAVKGGEPGSPTTAKVRYGTTIIKTVRTSPGPDAHPPKVSLQEMAGDQGKFLLNGQVKIDDVQANYTDAKIEYIKDLYLSGRSQESLDHLNKLSKNLKSDKQAEEVALLNSQITRGLDYFGDKRGLAPILSFETQTAVFRREVRRSLKFMSFVEWLKSAQSTQEEIKKELEQQQETLFAEVEEISTNYEKALEDFPTLRNLRDHVAREESLLKTELNNIENKIRRRVYQNHRESTLVKALKSASVLASVIPAGQPATALVAQSLNALASLQSASGQIDFQRVPSVLSTVVRDYDIEESAQDLNQAYQRFRFSELRELDAQELEERLKEMTTLTKPIVLALQKQIKIWQAPTIHQDQYAKEIAQLKKTNSDFKAVAKSIEEFTKMRVQYETKLAQSLELMTSRQQEVAQRFKDINEINSEKALVNGKIHPNIVRKMESRLQEYEADLLNYHAQMAKAYQYRMLEPYTGELNLKKVKALIAELIKEQNGSELSQQDFTKIEGLYTQQLSAILNKIVQRSIERGQEKMKTVSLSLSPQELKALENGHDIYLNLEKKGLFSHGEQEARLEDVRVSDIALSSSAPIEVRIDHVGEGILEKDQQEFSFRYHSSKADPQFSWGHHVDPVNGHQSAYSPTLSQQNLFMTFLNDVLHQDKVNDMKLFSRPAARTNLKISLKNKAKVELDLLKMEIDYSFFL